MKKILLILNLSLAFIVMLCSCGGKKATPEEEVRNYGKYFVEKLNANQLDSLMASYPDISKADSIVPLQSDSIIVAEAAPGQFDVTLAEGITLKVNRSEDGNITVAESKGLFAFPAEKVDIAKKTGMWDDILTDAQLNERMKDEEFFKWIKDYSYQKIDNLLSITPGKQIRSDVPNAEANKFTVNLKIKNNSNKEIKGSDYKIKYIYYGPSGSMEPEIYTLTGYSSGIDLKGGDEKSITISKISEGFKNFMAQYNIKKEEYLSNYYNPSGNEYQEYLDSKK